MISLKKSYARQLLQLALTLSLLRVDPESYLGWGWESQLALQNGDGWQLALRAAPLTDYSYTNRKALIPLIEDLVRFDRQTSPSNYDVQTYLLNVQNEQISLAAGSQPSTTTNAPSINNQPFNEPNSTSTQQQQSQQMQQSQQGSVRNTTEFSVPINSELADFFLNSDQFAESVSVFDQNIADLHDYESDSIGLGDIEEQYSTLAQLYSGIPLKDEPPEIAEHPFSIHFTSENDQSIAATASTSSEYCSMGRSDTYGLMRTCESPTADLTRVIEWSDYFKSESESDSEDNGKNELNKNIKNEKLSDGIKTESESEDDDHEATSSLFDDGKNSTSGFSSNVELTEEVSVESNYKKYRKYF